MKKVTISIELAEKILVILETVFMPSDVMDEFSAAIQKAKEFPEPFQSKDIQLIKERLSENDRKIAECYELTKNTACSLSDLRIIHSRRISELEDRVNVLEAERNQITKDWESVYFAKKVKE